MTMQKPGRRGRPPRKSASPQEPTKTTISIGNCRVEFPGSSDFTSDAEGLCIDLSDAGTVGIKVVKEAPISLSGFSFTVLNPKSLDGDGKVLLQDVLKHYTQELPAMNYAANTGKESRFLENCVLSGNFGYWGKLTSRGIMLVRRKYCTLILRNAELELVGAITYQLLPTDTNQAEVPLAAVAQAHHRKGFGTYLCKELQRRLIDVGVLSIFCWGDQESEPFWARKGFVTVAEVDGRGKPCKLPIKADVRRAMSIPGSATLMISYLVSPSIQAVPGPPMTENKTYGEISEKTSSEICKTTLENSPPSLKPLPQNGEKELQKSSPLSITTPQVLAESKSSQANTVTPRHLVGEKNFCTSMTPFNMEGMLSTVASEDPKETSSKALNSPAASVKITRPPLSDTTNTGPASDGANRPLKKRPNARVGLSKISTRLKGATVGVSTTSLGVEEKVAGQEAKADEARSPIEPKISTSAPMGRRIGGRRIGLRRRGGLEGVHEEAQVEEALDKENQIPETSQTRMESESVPAAVPEEKPGGKRGRESEAQMNVFGRRASRRRKADSVTRAPSKEESEDQTKKDTTKYSSQPEIQCMFDVLLHQKVIDSGRCNAVDAKKSAERDCQEANRVNERTTPFKNPNLHTNVELEKSSRKDAEPTPRPADAPGRGDSDAVESGGVQGPQKSSPEVISSCGAEGQSLEKTGPVIMFMNMSDENKKKQLTKKVEGLSGTVTSDGSKCTHVVYSCGEVRRTRNFCVAISSGAWILTSDWLKTSARQKSFADEERFVLRDRKFEAKYKVSLYDVIRRAKQRPNLLLDGMYVYTTVHVYPPVDTISQIVEAAGGKVLESIEEALQLEDKSHAVAIATEEDMSDAISAAKAGLRTFCSDWLLTCIVKQELDLTAPQFSESL